MQWIPELSTADVQIEFSGTGKRYILTVTMNQLAILSCFKGTTPLAMNTLQQQSLLPDSIFKQIVDSLIRFKLFTLHPSDNTLLCINERFKARHPRINLIPLSQSEEASQELLQNEVVVVDECKYTPDQRSNILQAIIVRFMKQHKYTSHQILQSHVITTLATRFEVSMVEFNDAITVLLDKEYIAKCSEPEVQELLLTTTLSSTYKNLIVTQMTGEQQQQSIYKYLP
jgi:hypothetical protein